MTISKEDLARRDNTGKWRFHELAVGETSEFAVAVTDNTLHKSCAVICVAETSIKEKMKISKEHFKANPQFSVNCMRETIEITINDKSFDAEVGFEMVDGVITDINTLFIIVDGLHRNINYLIESLKEGLVEDIETKLHKRVKDED